MRSDILYNWLFLWVQMFANPVQNRKFKFLWKIQKLHTVEGHHVGYYPVQCCEKYLPAKITSYTVFLRNYQRYLLIHSWIQYEQIYFYFTLIGLYWNGWYNLDFVPNYNLINKKNKKQPIYIYIYTCTHKSESVFQIVL